MGKKNDFSAERQSLKDKLTAIILLETAKDHKEMDSDLVTECVDFLMELEGKEKLTKKEIEQRVSEIPFKGKVTAINSYAKKKIRAKRLAVIAAVLAVLLAIFSIIAISFGCTEDNVVSRYVRYVVEFMNGGDQLKFENIELIKPNETKKFSSAEELVRYENIGILFPTWLPEDEKITKCWYIDDEIDGKHYIFQFKNPQYSMIVYCEESISDDIKTANSIRNVGELKVYIASRDGLIQGMFENKGYFYSIDTDTEENLLKIIDNLKEIE